MTVTSEQDIAQALEPLDETLPPARLALTAESWNEVVRLVENPPAPTDDLRTLFEDDEEEVARDDV